MAHLSWLEACTIGLLQGVAELFPVSSLGHSVLLPAVIGGNWAHDLDVSAPESPYLAFIVGLHVATALALLVYFWSDWVRITIALLTSLRDREVRTADQRLAWLLVLATIPVGLTGLLLEHTFRTRLGRPTPAAVFLLLNGLMLLAAERLRRRADADRPVEDRLVEDRPVEDRSVEADVGREQQSGASVAVAVAADRRLAGLSVRDAVLIGAAQIAALAPGISRSGAAMATGLLRGLSHEDAARFSFLLATPVILAAGVLKLPDLAGPLGDGIRGQVLVASLLSGLGAYASVRFLTRYFHTRSLTPFAVYCLIAGVACLARVTLS